MSIVLLHHFHALYHVISIIPTLKDTWRHNIPSEHRAPSLPELFREWEVCGDTINGDLMLCDAHFNGGGRQTRVEDTGIKLTGHSVCVPGSPLGLHDPGTLSQTAKYFKYQLECISRGLEPRTWSQGRGKLATRAT